MRSMNAPGSPSSPLQMTYLRRPAARRASAHFAPGGEARAAAAAQAGGRDRARSTSSGVRCRRQSLQRLGSRRARGSRRGRAGRSRRSSRARCAAARPQAAATVLVDRGRGSGRAGADASAAGAPAVASARRRRCRRTIRARASGGHVAVEGRAAARCAPPPPAARGGTSRCSPRPSPRRRRRPARAARSSAPRAPLARRSAIPHEPRPTRISTAAAAPCRVSVAARRRFSASRALGRASACPPSGSSNHEHRRQAAAAQAGHLSTVNSRSGSVSAPSGMPRCRRSSSVICRAPATWQAVPWQTLTRCARPASGGTGRRRSTCPAICAGVISVSSQTRRSASSGR